jgi:hypothetical protein
MIYYGTPPSASGSGQKRITTFPIYHAHTAFTFTSANVSGKITNFKSRNSVHATKGKHFSKT